MSPCIHTSTSWHERISLYMMSLNILSYCSKIKLFRPMINSICSFIRSNINASFLIIYCWISSLMRLRCWYHLDAISVWREPITTLGFICLLMLTRIKGDSRSSRLLWLDRWLLILLIAVIIKAFRWVDIWTINFIEIVTRAGINTCIKILVCSSIYFFDWLGKSGCRLVPVLICCIHS